MEKIKLSFKEKIVKIKCEMSVTVTYENSDGIINIVRLKFISCGEEYRSSCLWLTDESYVNFACLYCDWNSYSPMMELYNDTLSYIEDYLVSDGYAKIRYIDSAYEKYEFTKKIMSSEFERSYENLITGDTWPEKFKYLIDTNDEHFISIYVSELSSGNVRLVAKLPKNGTSYEEYCNDTIDTAVRYFKDKAEKRYL